MPTSVHIPTPLLEAVDRSALRRRVSRNRFIVQALETVLAEETSWSDSFFEQLSPLSGEDAATLDEVVTTIAGRRTRKKPPRL